jgi:cysteine desulfuration protein SufE
MEPSSFKTYLLEAKDAEELYERLIALGNSLPKLIDAAKTPENLVTGCQSVMYCIGTLKDGKLYFECDSEALISKGIAALLVNLLSGLTPEEVIKNPLLIIQELKLPLLLSQSRSNGLLSLHTKMKRIALNFLVNQALSNSER